MKVIAIVGSRSESRQADEWIKEQVRLLVTSVGKDTVFISGGASSGADFWCRYWCAELKLPYIEAPAFWHKPSQKQMPYGFAAADKSAGLRRNTVIADVCTEAVAIWDGKSPGTKDLIDKVTARAKHTNTILWPEHLSQQMNYGKGTRKHFVKLP